MTKKTSPTTTTETRAPLLETSAITSSLPVGDHWIAQSKRRQDSTDRLALTISPRTALSLQPATGRSENFVMTKFLVWITQFDPQPTPQVRPINSAASA
ncbi:hypothetical protein KTF37_26925 [Burkholderia multivorans]|uniref:hypothetical protein n=1 Tax=Burkholderia multivorans TaxID=87883 RepID=UPI001C226CB8|nr:hypothetical protein [Burkholderia multivorans]MBU9680488.1 hypothetical protein [Burkholderia multivorans]